MVPIATAVLAVLVGLVLVGTYLSSRAEESRERAARSVERIVHRLEDPRPQR